MRFSRCEMLYWAYRSSKCGSRMLRSLVWRSTRVPSQARWLWTKGPVAEYESRVRSGSLREDEHQRHIVQALQDLHEMLAEYRVPARKSFWSGRWFDQTETAPRGLYMYGDVGSGKTMLMDLFYDTLQRSKRRIHFHAFMQDVHLRLHRFHQAHGQDTQAVQSVAADIASQGSVLCFDEFQCTDVADAMILRSLLQTLMAHGVVLVVTSNRPPDDLYKNGIQRASFLPCINMLKSRLRVLNIDSTTDYRKLPKPPSGVYHHPLDKAARSHADKWFRFLGSFAQDPPHTATHTIWGRPVTVPVVSGDAARFTFAQLMGRDTGAADYLELTRRYHAFIITDVPAMTLGERDQARRFITFIDAVYDSRAKLVLTTARPLHQLFLPPQEFDETVDISGHVMENAGVLRQSKTFRDNDEEVFAFSRALSRLSEMGSQEWVDRGLGLEHRGGLQEHQDWKANRL